MKKRAPRAIAVFLCLLVALPDSAFSLRTTQEGTGLEELTRSLRRGRSRGAEALARRFPKVKKFPPPTVVDSVSEINSRASRHLYLVHGRTTASEGVELLSHRRLERGLHVIRYRGELYPLVGFGNHREVVTDIFLQSVENWYGMRLALHIHNHPDVNPIPSEADYEFLESQREIKEGGRFFVYGSSTGRLLEYGIGKRRGSGGSQNIRLRYWKRGDREPRLKWAPWQWSREPFSVPWFYLRNLIRQGAVRIEADDAEGRWLRWEKNLTLASVLKQHGWVQPRPTDPRSESKAGLEAKPSTVAEAQLSAGLEEGKRLILEVEDALAEAAANPSRRSLNRALKALDRLTEDPHLLPGLDFRRLGEIFADSYFHLASHGTRHIPRFIHWLLYRIPLRLIVLEKAQDRLLSRISDEARQFARPSYFFDALHGKEQELLRALYERTQALPHSILRPRSWQEQLSRHGIVAIPPPSYDELKEVIRRNNEVPLYFILLGWEEIEAPGMRLLLISRASPRRPFPPLLGRNRILVMGTTRPPTTFFGEKLHTLLRLTRKQRWEAEDLWEEILWEGPSPMPGVAILKVSEDGMPGLRVYRGDWFSYRGDRPVTLALAQLGVVSRESKAGLEERFARQGGTARRVKPFWRRYYPEEVAARLLKKLTTLPGLSGQIRFSHKRTSELLGRAPSKFILLQSPQLVPGINQALAQAFQGAEPDRRRNPTAYRLFKLAQRLKRSGIQNIQIEKGRKGCPYNAKEVAGRLLEALLQRVVLAKERFPERVSLSYGRTSRLLGGQPSSRVFVENPRFLLRLNQALNQAFQGDPPNPDDFPKSFHCWKIARSLKTRGILAVYVISHRRQDIPEAYDPAEVATRLLKNLPGHLRKGQKGPVSLGFYQASKLLGNRPTPRAFYYNPRLAGKINRILTEAFGPPRPHRQVDPQANQRQLYAKPLKEQGVTSVRLRSRAAGFSSSPAGLEEQIGTDFQAGELVKTGVEGMRLSGRGALGGDVAGAGRFRTPPPRMPRSPVESEWLPKPNPSHSPFGNNQTLTQNREANATTAPALTNQGMGLTSSPDTSTVGRSSLNTSMVDRATNSLRFSDRNGLPTLASLSQPPLDINVHTAAGLEEPQAGLEEGMSRLEFLLRSLVGMLVPAVARLDRLTQALGSLGEQVPELAWGPEGWGKVSQAFAFQMVARGITGSSYGAFTPDLVRQEANGLKAELQGIIQAGSEGEEEVLKVARMTRFENRATEQFRLLEELVSTTHNQAQAILGQLSSSPQEQRGIFEKVREYIHSKGEFEVSQEKGLRVWVNPIFREPLRGLSDEELKAGLTQALRAYLQELTQSLSYAASVFRDLIQQAQRWFEETAPSTQTKPMTETTMEAGQTPQAVPSEGVLQLPEGAPQPAKSVPQLTQSVAQPTPDEARRFGSLAEFKEAHGRIWLDQPKLRAAVRELEKVEQVGWGVEVWVVPADSKLTGKPSGVIRDVIVTYVQAKTAPEQMAWVEDLEERILREPLEGTIVDVNPYPPNGELVDPLVSVVVIQQRGAELKEPSRPVPVLTVDNRGEVRQLTPSLLYWIAKHPTEGPILAAVRFSDGLGREYFAVFVLAQAA